MTQSDIKSIEFAAFIGIDWADQKHDISLQENQSTRIETSIINHTSDDLIDWITSIQQRFGGKPVAIGIEQKRGALIYALMQYDFIVLYPINPKSLANYRKAFVVSGAKDDPLDSGFLLEMVRMHRDKLHPWIPDNTETREIVSMVEYRRKLINESTRITNRLTSQLKLYFPQALNWIGELATQRAIAFLTQWPDLQSLQKESSEVMLKFFQKHRYRLGDKTQDRLDEIRKAKAITTDQAVIKSSIMMVQVNLNMLKGLIEGIAQFDKQIELSFSKHQDYQVFDSLPGAGKVMAPRLLAAIGSDRDRYTSAQDIQSFSGIAPVTKRSGKKKSVHQRIACPKFIKQSFHEFAACSIPFCSWAHSYYDKQRERGHSHHQAIRSLAYKWIRIIFKCWIERQPYDDAKYNLALEQRRSVPAKVN